MNEQHARERAEKMLQWWGYDLETWTHPQAKYPPFDEMRSNIEGSLLTAFREGQESRKDTFGLCTMCLDKGERTEAEWCTKCLAHMHKDYSEQAHQRGVEAGTKAERERWIKRHNESLRRIIQAVEDQIEFDNQIKSGQQADGKDNHGA